MSKKVEKREKVEKKEKHLAEKPNDNFSFTNVHYEKANGFTSSELKFDISGKNVDFSIVNTLRRISLDNVPTYAFVYVNIEYNNSVFNNDWMRLRLSQIPIYDVDLPVFYLHPRYWQNVDYYNKNREVHESEKKIELFINVYNNKNEDINVTTDDITYRIEDELVKYPTRGLPILIIKLRPGETFKAQLRGMLGTGENNNIWAAAAQTWYDEINDNSFTFWTESQGQINEFDYLIKSCQIVQSKLEGIHEDIKARVDAKEIDETQTIIFDIINEDHTIGNLLNNRLQDNGDILFSGVSKPDHLVKNIRFKIKAEEGKTPIQPMFKSIRELMAMFKELEHEFRNLRKKHIGSAYKD